MEESPTRRARVVVTLSSRWREVSANGKLLVKATLTRARVTAKIWVFELAVSIAIVTTSIFQLLSNPGFYAYSDQYWPVVPSLPNTESFSPLIITNGRFTPVSFFQFTRDFVTFPYLAVSQLGIGYETEIRVFLFGSFLLLIGLTWATAAVLLRLLERTTSTKLSPLRREFVKLFFVLALYSNFIMIQLNADGGQLSDSLIIVGLVLAVCLLVENSRRAPWLIGALLSLDLFLDPDYYILVMIGLITITLVAGIQSRSLLARLGAITRAVMFSLPALFFVLAGIQVTATPGGLGATYRSVADAIWFSRNMTPLTAMLSQGLAWPFVTLGPPSILTTPGPLSSLPSWGSPTVLLLPTGAVASIWVASTLTLPILCFSSLLVRGARRVALPVVTMGLVGIGLAQYAQSTFLYDSISSLSHLPVVGFAIGTTFAIPDHILIIVSVAEVVAATITVFSVLSPKPGIPDPRPAVQPRSDGLPHVSARTRVLGLTRRTALSRGTGTAFAIIAVVLVVFAGWQALNGSYYPARPLSSDFIGNGVPNVGALTPYEPPNYTLQAYQYLFRSGWAFNVYWPVGYGIGLSTVTSGPPLVSLPGLPYLLSQGLVGDVSTYLAAHGVRYVVVENLTQPIPQFYLPSPSAARNLYLYYFGTQNYTATNEMLGRCPGLNDSFSRPGITVFEVSTSVGLGYSSSLLLHSDSEAGENATLYGAFAASGINVSLTDSPGWGQVASIGESPAPIRVLSPLNLSGPYLRSDGLPTAALNTTVNAVDPGVIYFANSTGIHGSAGWSQNQSQGQFNTMLDGFYFTNWGGNYTVTVTSGHISVFSRDGATFTLNYGGPAATTSDGVVIAGGVGPLVTGLRASISVSDPSLDSITAAFSAVGPGNETLLWNETSYASNSTSSASVAMDQLLPSGFSDFTYRLGGTFEQYFNITDYNLSAALDPVLTDRNAPFGGTIDMGSADLPVPGAGGVGMALVSGNGSINGVTISSLSLSNYEIPISGVLSVHGHIILGSLILFQGDNLSAYLGHYVAYNGAFSNAVQVEYGGSTYISPISTVYGTNLYVLPGGESYMFVVSNSLVAVEMAYPLVLLFVAALIVVGLRRRGPPAQRNAPESASKVEAHSIGHSAQE
jgi:hypothetical protein